MTKRLHTNSEANEPGCAVRTLPYNPAADDSSGGTEDHASRSSGASRPESEQPDRRITRVFYLVDSLNLGGTEQQAVEVARRLDPHRFHLTVGCLRREGPLLELLRQAGIPVVEFHPGKGLFSPMGVLQFFRLVRFLRRGKFHIAHLHDLWSNLIGVPAARLAHTPVIISSRRDLANWWWYTPQKRKILRRVQSLSTSVLANSEAVRGLLVREDGFRADRIRVIRNAVDLERFTRIPPDRERLFPGLGRDDQLVIVVANMNSLAKGHGHLIQAARIVCLSLPKTRFVLVGDGELRGKFERQVKDLGLHQNFLFLGQRRDVPELLRCCDVSVLPSTGEGLPNVVLEAMAAGLPVVATRVGGTTEIIEDGRSGLLVPPGDSDALAQVILRLLQDPQLARELAHAGQEQVRTQFNFDQLIANLESFYTELLRQQGRFTSPAITR